MSASHAHASQVDRDLDLDGRSPGAPRPDDAGRSPASIAGTADPRFAGGVSAPGLMALQRSAGNAAVASLVAPRSVQRAVEIGEVTTSVDAVDSPPETAGAGGAGASGAVTSDGGTTTITGAVINLDSAMTQTSGVIRAGTIIADSVVAASYSPGAGNVW
ncbi:MAG TPA: hypothetical protein VIZ22_00040 [Candidatus Limnocylindrales bacterium]